ncbi:MAG: Ubiquinone biosynthesis protein coq9, mitochondrial [Chaenotheca gracillima]|nr:MAG: Ubiquinone biosynthesis protein coq9, mitochondrial [Chaenotheca gracillima]
MRPPAHSTTNLPSKLLDELGEQERPENDRRHSGKSSRRGPQGRKERRKYEREQKKEQQRSSRTQQPKRRQFDHAPPSSEESATEADAAQVIRPQPQEDAARNGDAKPLKSILKKSTQTVEPRSRQKAPQSPSPPPRISKGVQDRLAQDDHEIAELEKKLGIKGKKKLPKSFEDEGLDLLLDGLDDGPAGESRTGAKRKRTEEEEWLQKKRKRAQGISEEEEDEVASIDGSASSEDLGEEENESEASGDPQESEDDFEGFGSDSSNSTPPPKKIRENPYVAPVTSSTPASSKYIPPSLRKPSNSETEALSRLRRQLQGLLNRLSEANLLTILTEVEQIYRQNPRQHVTSTLIDLLLGLVCDKSGLTDTFLILHGGFIAALYKVVGIDFGAATLQRIVEEFDRCYNKLTTHQINGVAADAPDSKEASNLVSLLAELYNFQVVGSQLIFDYIRLFLASISETNTELLLRVIKNCGSQLRQDDPSALKDIVLMLQPAVARVGEGKLSVRTKFMIETINNLKNNRMKTGQAASALVSENTIRMKKLLGSLNSRSLRASEPMRVGLKDIKDTEKKGKWWLVGASWKGDGPEERISESSKQSSRDPGEAESISAVTDSGTADLLKLAKEQRMNTDIRRAIFITIMSASDHQDAYLRLMKLRLKRSQEQEIPRVLLHCAGAEQSYNPYYTLIARKLCGEHRMRMAFQFGLWDLFKRMGEQGDDDELEDRSMGLDDEDRQLGMRSVVNYAKLYGRMISDGGMGLSVLKKLNLTYLQPNTQTFVELLLITIILRFQQSPEVDQNSQKALANIFVQTKEEAALARGLQIFLRKVVSKTDVAGGKAEKAAVRQGCKVAIGVLSDINISAREQEES